jgi:hypothetical protein
MTVPTQLSPRVARLFAKERRRRGAEASEAASLPRLECVWGQEIWGEETLRVTCCKCFGAFRVIDVAQ